MVPLCIACYEDEFRHRLNAKHTSDLKKEAALRRKQIAQAEKRLTELSMFFKRMYEDNVSGKLSDARFMELSADYEAEQAELQVKMVQWQSELVQQEQHAGDVERFVGKCKKYVWLTELTPTILNELIHKVYVEAPDKSSGKRRQGIRISYDLLGFLPELKGTENERTA